MATLLLTAAGQAAGGALGIGGIGSVLGRAAGGLAGAVLDQSLFGSGSRTLESGRLDDLTVQTSSEGAPLPRVYGRVRLSGQVIWATNFEEVVSEETQGGKGGPPAVTVRSYSYYAGFAVALCVGEVARFGRIWADGKILDTGNITLRIYNGSENQPADPLIEAMQGETPAYRGIAYVVFERLALEPFGNRLPQLSFEVIRPIEPLEPMIRAVTVIPGAGEFVYSPQPVYKQLGPGHREAANRHVVGTASDWSAAIDELQALCPALESVALVVSWFGNDLRAGTCTIQPKVETSDAVTTGATWRVSGLGRSAAQLVSQVDGRPAFGGTPSDDTVIAAVSDLKSRGLKVLLYPFILMDVPAGNGLPDPHGGSEQAAYPWRGRIVPGAEIAADANGFFGTASASDFSAAPGSVTYSGPDEWSFRRHILHIAALGAAAGGVDTVLIGSELRGLTRAPAGGGSYPFVDQLVLLAQEVRAISGPATEISYAADWSEYGAHQVSADELRFPLDPLWADAGIDFVGIDNYLPLSDFRDGGDPDGNRNPYDLDVLTAGITGGEYADWFYASDADRNAGIRTPITDGAEGKPWVYRAKDLKGWWQNFHYERVAGAELGAPTGWVAGGKPIRFTELGFPAVDRGTNQPNVFVDPKSSESALPHFSQGTRDDLIQRRALEAHLSWWQGGYPDLGGGDNPISAVYGGPMVDPAGIYLWTYDARPYPAFPVHGGVWGDTANWQTGHWLTGRLGAASAKGLIRAILDDYGIASEDVAVAHPGGSLDGYVLSGPVSARDVLEPLLAAFDALAADRGTHIEIDAQTSGSPVRSLSAADLAVQVEQYGALVSRVRAQNSELPSEVRLTAEDARGDFARRSVASRRLEGGSRQVAAMNLSATWSADVMRLSAERRLHRIWMENERFEFALGPRHLDLEPGDIVVLEGPPERSFSPPVDVRIMSVEDTHLRRVEAIRTGADLSLSSGVPTVSRARFQTSETGPASTLLMDLPKLSDDDPDDALRIAVYTRPWPGALALMRTAGTSGYSPVLGLPRPAVMGVLLSGLSPGPLWVVDRTNTVELRLFGGGLQGREDLSVFAGENALAIRSADGGFEILQFFEAELTAPETYRLTRLLRGQLGTETEMRAGALAGAEVVLLTPETVPLVPMANEQSGLSFNYLVVPEGRALDDPAAVARSHASTSRAAVPLAPVHLSARRESAGIRLSWIRQTRVSGGSWEQTEVPVGEVDERYVVEIFDTDDTVLRTYESTEPQVLYPDADEAADFGAPVQILTISVAQISQRVGPGRKRRAILHV